MVRKKLPKWATTVTPFSKYLAMALFILFPFTGFYLGMKYQQQNNLGRNKLGVITPTSTTILPQISKSPHEPNLLIITRPKDNIDNLPILMQSITDEKKVKQLYDEIYDLPIFLPHGGIIHCPIDFFARYTLDFYSNDELILNVVFDPTGCRTVGLSSGKTRWAIGTNVNNFVKDFQQTLNLSNLDFYGSQNGRPNVKR